MGYSANADLQDLFDSGPLEASCRRIARRSIEAVTDGAKERSPVADVPAGMSRDQFAGRRGRPPGTLKASWYDTPVVKTKGPSGVDRFYADSQTDDEMAPHVEYDTQPHIIRPNPERAPATVVESRKPRLPGTHPRASLTFWLGGRQVFRREVHHPGTQGQHMMRDSLAEVEGSWSATIGAEEVERWAREQARLVT